MQHTESKRIMIGKIITVVAVEGGIQDWSAYRETPWTGSDEYSVASYGDKLPQEVAEQIFPEWAKKYSWRD